jgi:hypothetical protein
MDDFNTNVLSEARNEYSSRLLNILTPLVIEGFKSIFKEAYDLCVKNDESAKYLMTFQNFLTRVPKWNQEIINVETDRILKTSKCNYLEDILTCVHITQLKILTSIRVSSKQKKIKIDIPKLHDFIHKVYITSARKLYQNVYLFEKLIMPLQHQKNMRECETIIRECILKVVRDSMPIEKILRAYIDETEEEEIIEEKIEKPESEVEEIVVEQTVDSAPVVKEELAPVTEIVKLQPEPIKVVDSVKLDDPFKPLALEDTPKQPEIATFSIPNLSLPSTPAKSIEDVIKSPKTSISFNNNDHVVQYEVDDKPNIISPTSSSLVSAPKTLERLEKISKERNDQRKLDEEEDDDERLQIFGDSPLSLDALDVQVLDNSMSLNNSPILTGVEILD